jgi:hypothetical protein
MQTPFLNREARKDREDSYSLNESLLAEKFMPAFGKLFFNRFIAESHLSPPHIL